MLNGGHTPARQDSKDFITVRGQEVPEVAKERSTIDVARSELERKGPYLPLREGGFGALECGKLGAFDVEFCKVDKVDVVLRQDGIERRDWNGHFTLLDLAKVSFTALIQRRGAP